MYQYKACGLDNVWLENGYKEWDTAYGKGVSVENADALHKLLAIDVAKKDGPLNRQEFRFLRTMLSLSQKSLGEMVGLTEGAVQLWERYGKIPKVQEAFLRTMILDMFDGHGKMLEAIERINVVDRLVNQRRVAKAVSHKWRTKVQKTTTELETA